MLTKEEILEFKKQALERREKEYKERIENFKTMEAFNGDINKIPEIPIVDKEIYDTIIIPNLIRCGAIPKNELNKGVLYIGICRNAESATWNGERFNYLRYKFGTWLDDTINHFEDDDHTDVFVPLAVK